MSKNANFIGQPIFSQLLNFLPKEKINKISVQYQGDHYVKRFKTYDHLVTMLYSSFHNCRSIREVVTGMMACQHKLEHLGITDYAKRSTLSDSNKRRDSSIFEQIYYSIFQRYCSILSDSQINNLDRKLFIVDSTTISLFQEILKNAGPPPLNGKRKGGIKAHVLMRSDQDVPCLVRMSSGATHDSPFLKDIQLPKNSILVFDRGYKNYEQYQRLDEQKITWVTRRNVNAVFEVIEDLTIDEIQMSKGVLSDERIILGNKVNKLQKRVKARRITYYDSVSKTTFEFLTNNLKMTPSDVAMIYQKRWQIEILFKRLKQNNQLKYFLGDNPNAIKIQIWCSLIADLIIKIIQKKVKRPWSFANLSSMIRIHLMSYTSLLKFLENPDKNNFNPKENTYQLSLFSSS